jgi:ABC-type polysaccharide/polyol phosphate transport system ATPase subunit
VSDVAISCEGVWKRYRLYEHRSGTIKDRLLSGRSHYRTLWALSDVSVEVRSGTSLGVIGANGSGKSTFLRVIAGILEPDRGSVRTRGVISSLLELGMGFHPELTGRENLFLSGVLMGWTKRDIAARYDDIVEFAGIESFMDAAIKTYSTGMYARLAFALATAVEPDILLVDEVLAVGDEAFQARSRARIAELWSEGRTVVVVSHSREMINDLCDSAVWLEGGVVKATGDVEQVTSAYGAATAVERGVVDLAAGGQPGAAVSS